MKPKPIMAKQDTLVSKKVKIETPMGSIESDSGSHIVDIGTILIIVLIIYLGKKLINKYVI